MPVSPWIHGKGTSIRGACSLRKQKSPTQKTPAQLESLCIAGGDINGAAATENSMMFSQKMGSKIII